MGPHFDSQSTSEIRSMKMNFLFSCCVTLVILINVANGFILNSPINTTTVIKYVTTTVNTYAACAVVTTDSPSAVTNCRRRRRNYWIDPAFYVALNNDDLQAQQFINPTRTHQVEPTTSAFKTNPFEEHRVINHHQDLFLLPGYYPSPSGVVQPSIIDAEEKYVDLAKLSLKWMAAMAYIKNKFMFGNKVGHGLMTWNASTTTTSTVTVVATVSTKTYVISGCRPSSPAIPACY